MTTNILLGSIIITVGIGGGGFEAQTQHGAALENVDSSLIEILHIHSSIFILSNVF